MANRKNPRTLLASLTLAAALAAPVFALPEGGQIVNGQVNIGSGVNGQMTIQQLSDRAIINWNGFSINASEALRFIQPSQLSAILNRVTGQDPSVILGSLQANGRVFLINPNGILFGPGSQVNVGSLMASTLNMTDENFLAGRLKFDQLEGKAAASIVNQGTLTVSPGGYLVLTAPLISNEGVIVANLGQVALAAGEHTEINFDGQGLINIAVEKPPGDAGPVAISHGMLDHMVGSLLNLSPAESITNSGEGAQLAGASGRLVNLGEIRADGAPGQDAGRVVVNSEHGTFLRPGSVISANGVGENSSGGSVLAISEGLAVLDRGSKLEARGGTSGDGGFVEFSGHTGVRFSNGVDVGPTGTFLLDPTNLRIVSGTGSLTPPVFFASGGTDESVSAADLNSFLGNLVLQATNSIIQDADAPIIRTQLGSITLETQTGDIILPSSVQTLNTGFAGQTLTVTAGGSVSLGNGAGPQPVFLGNQHVTITAGNDTSVGATGGNISMNNVIVAGANVTLNAGRNPANTQGGVISFPGETSQIGVSTLPGARLAVNATTVGAPAERLRGFNLAGSGGFEISLNGTTGDASLLASTGSTGGAITLDQVNTSGIVTLQTESSAAGNPAIDVVLNNISAQGLSVQTPGAISAGGVLSVNQLGLYNNSSAAPASIGSPLLQVQPRSGSTVQLQGQVSGDASVSALSGDLVVNGGFTSDLGSVQLQATAGTLTVMNGDVRGMGAGGTFVQASGDILTAGVTTRRIGSSTTQTVLDSGGNIGTAGASVQTAGSLLGLNAAGELHISNSGTSSIELTSNGATELESDSEILIGPTFTTSTTSPVSISTTSGAIKYDSANPVGTDPTISGSSVSLSATNGIGSVSPGSTFQVSTPNLVASTLNGDITIRDDQTAVYNVSSTNGLVLINDTFGDVIVGDTGISGGAGTYFVSPTSNLVTTATSGVFGSGGISYIFANSIGSAANPLRTQGPVLEVRSANGATINHAGSAAVNALVNGDLDLDLTGTLTVDVLGVSGGLGGAGVTDVTATQDILSTATSGSVGSAGTDTFLRGGNIGTSASPVKTRGSSIALDTTGQAHIQHTGAASYTLTNSNGDVSIASDADVSTGNTFNHSTGALSISTTGGHIQAVAPLAGTSVSLTASDFIQGGTSTPSLIATVTGTNSGASISLNNDQSATVSATGPGSVTVTTNAGSLTVGAAGVAGQVGTSLQAPSGDILTNASSGRVGSTSGFQTVVEGNVIGSSANPLKTAGGEVNFFGSQINAQNTGASAIGVFTPGGASSVTVSSDSNLSIGNTFATTAGATVNLSTSSGSLEYRSTVDTPRLSGSSVSLSAPGGVGTSASHIRTGAATLNASSSTGSVFIDELDGVAASGTAGQDYFLTAGGSLTLNQVVAGQTATLTSQGNMVGNGSGTHVQAVSANLTANGGSIGTSSSDRLNTQASTLNANGTNGVFLKQNGATSLSGGSSNGAVDIDVDGDIQLGLLTAATTLVLRNCSSGSIFDANGAANNIQSGQTATLVSRGTIGSDSDAIEVNVATGLLRVAANGQVNQVSINVSGTTPNNNMEVFDPAGTSCFSGLPPGKGLFNNQVVYDPAAPAPNPPANVPPLSNLPQFTNLAKDNVLVNPLLFNGPAFLDDKGRIMGSSFTPFYTLTLAFLLDKEDWLDLLEGTVVWEIEEDEADHI